jgi:hypothetical protein
MRKQGLSTITAVLLLFARFIVSCAGSSDGRTASASPTSSSHDQIQTTPATLAAKDPDYGVSEAAGIGFAIPSNTVRTVADRLIAAGP